MNVYPKLQYKEISNTINTSDIQIYFKTKKMKQETFEFVATIFDQIDQKFVQFMKDEEHNLSFQNIFFKVLHKKLRFNQNGEKRQQN